jgi:hypothetical protein
MRDWRNTRPVSRETRVINFVIISPHVVTHTANIPSSTKCFPRALSIMLHVNGIP